MTDLRGRPNAEVAWTAKAVMARHLREDHSLSLQKIQTKLGLTRSELQRILIEYAPSEGRQ